MNTLKTNTYLGSVCKRGHDGVRYKATGVCVTCSKEHRRSDYIKRRDAILAQQKDYKARNKEKIKASLAAWAEKNKGKLKEARKKARLKRLMEGRDKAMQWRKDRQEKDPVFDLACRIRSRISGMLKQSGFSAGGRTARLLGCSFDEFKAHIERQFLKGMTWENRHLWHLDHIVPLSSAKTIEQLELLCHVSNIRPMWAKENIRKSDKITHLI